jgi:hypothetical protein
LGKFGLKITPSMIHTIEKEMNVDLGGESGIGPDGYIGPKSEGVKAGGQAKAGRPSPRAPKKAVARVDRAGGPSVAGVVPNLTVVLKGQAGETLRKIQIPQATLSKGMNLAGTPEVNSYEVDLGRSVVVVPEGVA